ncbi:hypothetical protein PROFUN_01534 [Planoprotostelium fungivorum]|uniref:Uncharacterized protein n=1 Tax=Planoprotostelium fungivorum TaxID=1890364 RepID=A0A2P6NTI2_9EUKA|nr:hypothetical protein PROFUN_01534 [Planoprotostelium fungivorum]
MGTPLYVFTRGVCVSGKKKDAFYPTWNDSKVLGSKLSKAIFLSKGCTFTLFSITSVHSDQGFCKVDLKCCAQHLTSLTNWKARRKVRPLWGSTGRVTLGSLPSSFLEFLLDLQWLLSSSAHQTGMPCKQFGTLSKNSLLSTFSEDLKSAELHKKIQDQASRLRRSSSSGSV